MLIKEGLEPVVAKLVQLTAGEHYNIDIRQLVLLQTESFADLPLYAVALNGEANIFLADDQAEAGALKPIGLRQNQQVPVRHLISGARKNLLIICTAKQP